MQTKKSDDDKNELLVSYTYVFKQNKQEIVSEALQNEWSICLYESFKWKARCGDHLLMSQFVLIPYMNYVNFVIYTCNGGRTITSVW